MRFRTPKDIVFISAVSVSAFVALIAFLASYQHQYELVIHHGQTHWIGALYPLSVDLLIVGATLVTWGAAIYKWGIPYGALAVLATGAAATAIANLAADNPAGWRDIGPFISIWPAFAFVEAYEMTMWMVRKRRKTDGDNTSTWADADTKPARRKGSIFQLKRNRVGIPGVERGLPVSSAGRPGSNGSKRVDRKTLSVPNGTCGHANVNGNPGQLTRCPDCSTLVKVP